MSKSTYLYLSCVYIALFNTINYSHIFRRLSCCTNSLTDTNLSKSKTHWLNTHIFLWRWRFQRTSRDDYTLAQNNKSNYRFKTSIIVSFMAQLHAYNNWNKRDGNYSFLEAPYLHVALESNDDMRQLTWLWKQAHFVIIDCNDVIVYA